MMSLRLNEPKLITEILENIPTKDSKFFLFSNSLINSNDKC